MKDDRGELDLTRQIGELQCENAGLVDKYNKEHKLRQEAEGELTIVKGITILNAPEMRDAQKRIKELDNSLSIALDIKDRQQEYISSLQIKVTELEKENNKLAGEKVDRARKAGL